VIQQHFRYEAWSQLDEGLPNKWIGHGDSAKLFSRVSDFTPTNFFLCGFVWDFADDTKKAQEIYQRVLSKN
jgi:hypothetical protein